MKRRFHRGAEVKGKMKVENIIDRQAENPQIPGNLAEWIGEQRLVHLALDAVQGVNWKAEGKLPGTFSGHRPQMLLTLLTWCYAAGIYSSQDIARACRESKTLRYICARNFPDWLILRKFRRQHRELVDEALRKVLMQAWAGKLDDAETDYLGYQWIETDLSAQINASVRARLELAILLDGMDAD
jgi:hypothetical protein